MHSVSSGLAGVAEFWQTRQAQNLVGREAREGSSPSTRTQFSVWRRSVAWWHAAAVSGGIAQGDGVVFWRRSSVG